MPQTSLIKRLLPVAALAAIALAWYLLAPRSPEQQLQRLAERYVTLALSLEQYQEGEVDSYFGPADLDSGKAVTLQEIGSQAGQLADAVGALQFPETSQRQQDLLTHLAQLQKIAAFLQDPQALSFAEETGQLYQIPLAELPIKTRLDESGRVEILELPPTPEELERQAIVDELDSLLPGTGSLPFRVASFQARHMVPLDQRETVFERALAACRDATLTHWSLPDKERLSIEWTRDVSTPWHRYLGNGHSELRINPLTLGYIGAMVDVACHEGYPGHHAQYLLLESAHPEGLPIEKSLTLLRTPEAVLREGAGDYGIGLAMPWSTRLEFERDVLFPLAGLNADNIETYARIHALVAQLDMSTVAAIQEYSDGDLPPTAAAVRLESDSLVASPNALLDFVDKYNAYSVGYTLAERKLQSYIGANSSDAWQTLSSILGNPAELAPSVFAAD